MMNKKNKYFPIKTKTSCKLKWTWSTIHLHDAMSASCHRTAFNFFNEKNFSNFHNNDKVLQDRQNMLAGHWPETSCGYCREIEEAGGFSDRMLHLTIPGQIPDELAGDSTSINVTPKILEVYLNNVCNLGCLYCNESSSSVINNENTKFGPFEKNGVVLKSSTHNYSSQFLPLFLDWLQTNYNKIERLHILGGEPFYQKEFEILLDFLSNQLNPNCEINIVTNLMVSKTNLAKYIDIFYNLTKQKKIKRLDITCSIDCFGPQQEYVRSGLDLDQWKTNFEFLVSQKWIKLSINQVVTVLTIKTMPELLEYLQKIKLTRKIGQYFSTPPPQLGPSYMHPKILPIIEFQEDFEKVLLMMKPIDDDSQTAYNYMQGIIDECKSMTQDDNEILKLFTFLDEKDRRRGTNWKLLFPWLEKYVVQ